MLVSISQFDIKLGLYKMFTSIAKGSWVKDTCDSLCNFCIFPYEFIGASPVAQMVKNLPAVQETRVWSLGREDPLEKGMAAHSSIFARWILWTDPRVTKSQTWLSDYIG